MNVIEVKDLSKSYGKSRGITNISFSIEEGEIFGFIGPNGAGKSTTIRTLLGLIAPDSGTAKIFGKNCFKEGHEIRKQVGYLPSEVFYYDGMRAIDLLKYSASFYKKNCDDKIKSLAKAMNLDLNKKIDDMSFGNKKKVGIVQGLLHSPKLIILDEPTSGLDPLMQQTFFDLLQTENDNGASIMFSSHILSEVQKMCNRVAIVKEGKIIKFEKISALTESNYKRFKVETKGEVPTSYFDINGVNKLEVNGTTVSFLYKGDINTIVAKLAALELSNFFAEDPDLEEIFMHYYEKE